MPQVPRLFGETLRDNILQGPPIHQSDLLIAVNLAVLADDVAALARGLDTPVGARGVRLSGGQTQRAAAAGAHVVETDLLVVDDLSSALDVETERVVWERLSSRTDLAVLAVSHRRAARHTADLIVVLEHGRLSAAGTLPDLMDRSEVFQRLYAQSRREPGSTRAADPT